MNDRSYLEQVYGAVLPEYEEGDDEFTITVKIPRGLLLLPARPMRLPDREWVVQHVRDGFRASPGITVE